MKSLTLLLATVALRAAAQTTNEPQVTAAWQKPFDMAGERGPVTALFDVQVAQWPGGRRETIPTVYEPKSGYAAWLWYTWGPLTRDPNDVTNLFLGAKVAMTVAPDIGLVLFILNHNSLDAEIYAMKAPTLEAARRTIIARMGGDAEAAKACPLPKEPVIIRLSSALGRDFFEEPGSAQPFVHELISVGYTNKSFVIKFNSGHIKAKAVVTLDRQLKVVSAARTQN
jgi:hypothetical protein